MLGSDQVSEITISPILLFEYGQHSKKTHNTMAECQTHALKWQFISKWMPFQLLLIYHILLIHLISKSLNLSVHANILLCSTVVGKCSSLCRATSCNIYPPPESIQNEGCSYFPSLVLSAKCQASRL